MANYPNSYDNSISLPPVIPDVIAPQGPTGPVGPQGPIGPTGAMGYNYTWKTAVDIDFTTYPNQILRTDGPVIIGAYPFIKTGSAYETTPAQIVNGTGLVITPSIQPMGYTILDGLALTLSDIIPNFSFDTPIRAWIYESSNNESLTTGGATCNLSVQIVNGGPGNPPTNFYLQRQYQAMYTGYGLFNGGGVGDSLSAGSSYEAYNVMVIACNYGVGSFISQQYLGTYSGPSFSTENIFPYSAWGNGGGNYGQQINASTQLGDSSGWQVCFGSRLFETNPGYYAVIAKFKLEYMG